MDTTPGSTQAPTPPPSGGRVLHPTQAIAAGWQAFLQNVWVSIGVTLVLFAILCVGQLIPFVNLVFSLLVAPSIYAGGALFFLRGIRGEKPSFETAFEGFQRWASATGAVLIVFGVVLLIMLPMLFTLFGVMGIAALLSSRPGHVPDIPHTAIVPVVIVMVATYPALIWWSTRSYMALFVVMESDRPSAMDAVKRSFALTQGSVWRLIGFWLLSIPVALLGCLALCVGIIPAAIVLYYGLAHAYEQLRARAA
jgi:uncharacterized membrane protein